MGCRNRPSNGCFTTLNYQGDIEDGGQDTPFLRKTQEPGPPFFEQPVGHAGDHDLIVRVEVETLEELRDECLAKIRCVEGITKTTTCLEL